MTFNVLLAGLCHTSTDQCKVKKTKISINLVAVFCCFRRSGMY